VLQPSYLAAFLPWGDLKGATRERLTFQGAKVQKFSLSE
jgi:hypothetical protein